MTQKLRLWGKNEIFNHISENSMLAKNEYKTRHVVLFTNPSARAGYDTKSIFKRSLTGLNSEFSFT